MQSEKRAQLQSFEQKITTVKKFQFFRSNLLNARRAILDKLTKLEPLICDIFECDNVLDGEIYFS